MPYKGNRRKKRYTHERLPQGVEPEIDRTIPRSVIVHTDATLDASMSRLIMDWRKCFLPHTMIKLALRSRNKLKDYAALHTSLGVSHLHMFSSPDFGATLRLARLPAGPTVLFRVESYTTMRDIVALLRRPFSGGTNQYMVPPMVVLSGFSTSKVKNEPHIALLRELLPSLVPTVAVDQSLKMSKLQRVLFFHYLTDEEGEGLIEVRHYYITARPVGLNRAIQKLKDGKIPRTVGTSDSFSEVLTHEGLLSDTDGEGEEVRLPEDVEFRREKGSCRVKLVELGPRMTWRPLRVEAGLCGGEVLWHQYITKTPEEVHQLHERKKKMERLKRLRVKEQEENVNRKKQSENPIQGPETDNSQQTVEFPDMDGTTDHEGIKKARKEPSGVKKRVSFST